MDKMLVDSLGDITITNDGVTILEEMGIEHPAAKMIVEVAKTQEDQVGDGTTTAVVLAGELLKNAESLLDKDVHPTVIAKGYRMAAEQSQKILENISENISEDNEDILKKIAITAMTGKGASAKEKLADMSVKAVKQIMEKEDNKTLINLENIKLEKKTGDGVSDTELIDGLIIDKERLHTGMPRSIKNAKIALINSALEIKSTETDAKISINSPDQMEAFLKKEESMLKNMSDKIIKSGANVVICQKGIDDLIQHFLAKSEIYTIRRVKKSDMEKLARATNAKIINNLEELSKSDLGKAGLVEGRRVNDEEMTYVTDCINPKAVTILLRGGTEHVVDEVERAMKDALGDISATLKTGKAVGGAGSVEIELSLKLREYANKLSGREQLAVLAFAESLEIIPRTLAENAGIDPIDTITELKSQHESKKKWYGLDVFSGKVVDSWKNGVIEPLKIKTQAIKSASEVAELILRIDDVLASAGKESTMPINQKLFIVLN